MQKTASKRHRWYIAANLFFVFLLIGHLVSFTNNLRKVNTETQIHEFLVSTDGAKRKVRDYMETSSRTLRGWKKLIGLNDWTAEEIPRKLDDLISSADITAQVLLTDTLRGYSSAAPAGKPGEYGMEYSDTYFSIFQTLTRFRESGRPDDVIITSSFTNPINAETSIAFVTQIETRDESGAAASAFLLYVEPLRALQEVWTAFSEKENAQMSMINTMGDYTYRASMLKNENFYEYLISYNDLTYPQVEALRDTIRTAEEPGWIEYLNSKGRETLYAYSTGSQWGWTLIASIEMKELQWTILIISGFTFGMLYLVNSAYFRSLNRQLRSSLTQLEAANSAKTRFLSSVSHDIRTPHERHSGHDGHRRKAAERPGAAGGLPAQDRPGGQPSADPGQRHPGHLPDRERAADLPPQRLFPGGIGGRPGQSPLSPGGGQASPGRGAHPGRPPE